MDALASFGPYTILRAIAETRDSVSFAARYEGRKDKDHVLALKVMRPRMLAVPGLGDALLEEMRLAVRLNHVNVAQVFDLGQVDEHPYIALEFVDGIPLSMVHDAVAPGQKAVTTEVAAFVCAESCAGLAYAHGRRDERGNVLGIVHSRVSPRTVLLSKSGLVKVVDFGLARALTALAPEVTDNADLNFLAPEIVRGDEFDQRADIFAVGAIAHLLLTGRTIYEGAYGEELETKARRGYVPAILDTDDSVPEQLAELVDKALASNPEDRFEDATELRSGLAAWLRRNSPGFGRHRLKNYLTKLLPQATYGLLPESDWEPLHRKNFRFYDTDSVLAEHVETEPDVPSAKDPIAPLLDNPDVPKMKRLDLSAMDTGAHRMVRDQAFAAARSRGSVSQQRVTTGTRTRVVRTPPPMPAVGDDVFASRPFDSSAQPVADSGEGPALAPTDPQNGDGAEHGRDGVPAADAPAIAGPPPEPRESSADDTEGADGADRSGRASEPAAPAQPAATERPAGSTAEEYGLDADESYDDDYHYGDAGTAVDQPGTVQIDPSLVYDDSVDLVDQRAAVAEAAALDKPARPVGTILGILVGLLVLGGVAFGVKWTLDQQSAQPNVAETAPMVFVTSRPQGATVLIDGTDSGFTTPAPLRALPASSAQVTVSLPGFETPATQTLDPAAPPAQLSFDLEPTEHRIRIDSDPSGATVVLEGETVGTTPTVLGPMRVDYRRGVDLLLRLDGYLDEHVSVDWAAGETESSVRRPLHVDPNFVAPEAE